MQKVVVKMDDAEHEMDFVKMVGDIVFFKCPICADYERTLNTKTGALTRNRDSRIRHFGMTAIPNMSH